MPVTLYHLNPETERIGVCRAEQNPNAHRSCPFSSDNPHFASKEDARAYYENVLESEYGLFGDGAENKLSLRRDAVARRLNLLPKATLKGMVQERWRRGGWTARETEQQMAKGEPFYVFYNGNQEITLNIEDDATQRTFTKGACTVLAHEISRATGWPIALFSEPNDYGAWQGHAAVKMPDGRYLDATGVSSNPISSCADSKSWTEEELTADGLMERVGNPTAEGRTEISRLPLLERFAAAKFAFDLLDGEDLLEA